MVDHDLVSIPGGFCHSIEKMDPCRRRETRTNPNLIERNASFEKLVVYVNLKLVSHICLSRWLVLALNTVSVTSALQVVRASSAPLR